VDLTLDGEQRQLVVTARQFVERTYETAEQAAVTGGEPVAAAVLERLAPLGWTGLVLPEEVGGAEGTLVDLCLVLEELGRRGVSTPLICSTVAARLMLAAGGAEAHAELLAGVAEGTAIVSVAQLSPGVGDEWSTVPATAKATSTGWTLDGSFSLVAYGDEADAILVPADLEGRGLSIVMLAREQVEASRQRVVGGHPRSAVRVSGIEITNAAVLQPVTGTAEDLLADARDLSALLLSAHAVGACEGALQLSVTWAKDRQQFGRPIGSFQTVSNRCADMRIGIDAARLLTWEAAWAVDESRAEAGARVATAKAYLNDVSDVVVVNSHQVHGALGYSTEYPLHVLTRAIKAFQTSFGTSRTQLDRVADELGL
jgi:alkylation response protein AidB-like acyl-CoA dehydrogenase